MIRKLEIPEFLSEKQKRVVLDVRTPAEFAKGHIPGTHNLPLFSNRERAEIGTIYKQQGPQLALDRGLELVGPRMTSIIRDTRTLASGRSLAVHCWRGGKRSASVAWLLDMAGMEVATVRGGYKAYRKYLRDFIEQYEHSIVILGGRTGSGKTAMLQSLQEAGEQVLDLEHLASHKGSAFGWIGERSQPTSEHFENLVFEVLIRMDAGRRIWIENESKTIGKVCIPEVLWQKMKAAPLIHMEVPLDERVARLVDMYAKDNHAEDLREGFERIARRLGGQRFRQAMDYLETGDYHAAARIALTYYDKTYDYNLSMNNAPVIERISVSNTPHIQNAEKLVACAQNLFGLHV